MPAIRQKWIDRADLRANPDVLYLFGDNELRTGFGGQAKAMRGEPNAIGIRTKRAPGTRPGDFWVDDPETFASHAAMINEDLGPAFAHVFSGGTLVIPLDGLGTGLSEMPTRCPTLHKHLMQRIEQLTQMAVT